MLICALAASYTGMAQGFIGNGVPGGAGIEAVTTTGTNAVNVGIGVAAPSGGATLEVAPPSGGGYLGLKFDNLPPAPTPSFYLTYDGTSIVTYSPPPMATVSSVTINCDGTITVNGTTSTDGAWRTDGNVVSTTEFFGSLDNNDIRIVTNNNLGAPCPGTAYNPYQQKMIIGSDANNGNVEIGWDGVTPLPIPTTAPNPIVFSKFTVQNGTVVTNPFSALIGAPVSPSDIGIYSFANNQTTGSNNVGVASVINAARPIQVGYASFVNDPSAAGVFNAGVLGNVSGDGDNNVGFNFSVDGNNATNTGGFFGVGQSSNTTATNTGIQVNAGGSSTNNQGVDVFINTDNTTNISTFQNAGSTFNVSGNSTSASPAGANFGVLANVSGNNINDFGVSGTANGSNAGNVTGVSGQAFGANNSDNFGIYGRVLGNFPWGTFVSNLNSNCAGVYGTIDPNVNDANAYYGVEGDLFFMTPSSGNTNPYYAIYGRQPSLFSGGGSTYGTNTHYYAGYFEGDVYASNLYFSSDPKLKENIQGYTGALDKIKKLPVKSYTFRNSEFPKMNLPLGDQVGVLSTDLKAVFPNLVKGGMHPGNGKEDPRVAFDAVNYMGLIPVLVEAVQELDAKAAANPASDEVAKTIAAQQAQIAAQSQQLTEQTRQIAELRNMIEDLCSTGCAGFKPNTSPAGISPASGTSLVSGSAVLYQSTPNPTSGAAVIAYAINMPFTTASIQVLDKGGKTIRQYAIQQQGAGSVTFEGSATVAAGSYTYSLIIDGRVLDTKTMVIVKD